MEASTRERTRKSCLRLVGWVNAGGIARSSVPSFPVFTNKLEFERLFEKLGSALEDGRLSPDDFRAQSLEPAIIQLFGQPSAVL